jgi:hypothetical protein
MVIVTNDPLPEAALNASRKAAVWLIIVGMTTIVAALIGLNMTVDVAARSANSAIRENGGTMDSAQYQSIRQFAAYAHLAECGLVGIAGIGSLTVGLHSATKE